MLNALGWSEFVRPPPDENRSEYSIYPRFDLVYFLKITNQGKTPALILNWEVLSDCRARVTTAEQQEMWSGEVHGDINELIGAGSFRTLPYPIDPPTTFYEWGEVETGEKSGVCKVTIRYLDLVTLLNRSKDEPPRETSFRCLWDVANRKFIRLPNYNHFS